MPSGAATPRTMGTTVLTMQQGKWVTLSPVRTPLRRFRMLASKVNEHVAQQFNQMNDEMQQATAGSRDVSSIVRVVYVAYPFTASATVKIPHLLGTANVSLFLGQPRIINGSGVTSGVPYVQWQIDQANPSLVDVTSAGTFFADVEFRILPVPIGATQ